ncbi:MAG TPA: neuraminidase-like domain-containing protein, partial [Pyrinomonadaceae bacterium]|nr:neuraminidase-like domain-containing protein [Pyrinomonadaceae bacterium]
MKLELPAFNYLVRVSRVLLASASATLLESEWTDVINILVQVRKIRKYVDWRNEEKAANPNLSLSPVYFQSPPAMPFIRSTGTDANGALIPEGATDPNWTITAKPGVTGAFPAFATKPDPIWFPNRSTSRWISSKPDATVGDAPGNYTYRTTFDLTGFDPSTVQIRMQISADDELVDVKLNGQSLGLKIPVGGGLPFRMSHGMQITNGFIGGINTLEFIVNNAGTIINPTAIQAQLEFASVRRLPFPTWRGTTRARQEWESTLNGRIEQERSLKDAFRNIVNGVEEAILPMLRNALVAATGKDADWLTQRLLIDVKADSKVQTTRLNQAIETVQSLFFGLRNSDPPLDLGAWKLNRDSAPETNSLFDEQWNAIGSYAGWRAAMLVFLYPENLLRPTLRPASQLSSAFTTFLKAVRTATSLTRDAIAKMIADYLTAVRAANPGLIPPPPFTITEQLSEAQLLQFATQSAQLWAGKTEAQRRVLTEVLFDVPITLALQLQQAGDFETALAWYRTVYAIELPPGDVSLTDPREFRRIYPGLTAEKTIPNNYSQTSQWLLDSAVNPHQFATQRANAYTRFTLLSIVSCLLSFADSEFTTDSFESLPRARSLYINAREVLDMPELSQPPGDPRVKMNPVIAALRARAEVNLFKLRSQRNIAGMQREIASLSAPPASIVLSTPSRNGRSVSAGAALAPTQYRYATLIERAKQLVTIAQQIEASFLASLEKRDAEAYSILRARQDLDLSSAHITLTDLRVAEAADGVILAELQQDKSQFSFDHYQGLLQNDLSGFEIASMACLGTQVALQTIASTQAVIAAGGSAILSFLTFGLTAPDALSKGAEAAQMAGAALGMQAGMFDKMAGYERRKQEWQFQRDVAVRDKMLSDQQHQIALDQQQVVLQEQVIANTQQQHALATVNFLATKFTNVELYEYMAGILQEVYSFFLQQASAMARLAQNQLAFERQEPTLSFIQADYWQTPSNGSDGQSSPDRRGMTGSARLLRDIFELDQHAFATDQRKLQLTKTISLAQMAPFEFQRFRETGVLPVAISRQIFDQDFPGHYLRLIKRVRTCVLALIPPTHGIKATLSNSGVSRTTIGGSAFQDVVVCRDPQSVALTSPMNATGLFELDAQPELLLPFEGLGVETSWEFQMPKAANFINYDSIADVLITIEYTALSDAVYREQVIQQLDRKFNADRALSLQQHLPDSWYDIHNPEQLEPARRFRAEFSIAETDFPLNLERDSLKTSHLLVYFVPTNGEPIKVTNIGLTLLPEGAPPNTTPLGGDASSDRGLLSTRSGSAPNWGSCVGVAPFGKWTLDLSQDAALQALLAADKVRDILFVLSYNASTPPWPS